MLLEGFNHVFDVHHFFLIGSSIDKHINEFSHLLVSNACDEVCIDDSSEFIVTEFRVLLFLHKTIADFDFYKIDEYSDVYAHFISQCAIFSKLRTRQNQIKN